MNEATRILAALTPLSLKDAPALIESVFPAQKVSFEAQKERKANLGQTLTGLGSYWKGRKPLILVRAIILGSLLPQTNNPEADLDIFEMLMAFDEEGLARRALVGNALSATKLQELIPISDPERYFSGRGWRRDVTEENKLVLYRRALATFPCYEVKATLCKRPEELDQEWLYAPAWLAVNRHYAHLGIDAHSFPELIEQLGILRYGHRPRLGDTFSGGGSIPFEAARLGCDVYAADLNPVACMLTWGALNIIGASEQRRTEIEQAQREVAKAVDAEITALGIEHDENGNRAKAYLYCLETRCPETGWMVPMSPSWVISKTRNVIAHLKPDHANKRFHIDVRTGVCDTEMKAAEKGTEQDGALVYEVDGKTYRTPIKTLRGDYRDAEGHTGNRLRRWEKDDFKPCPNDIFQERLYAIQWVRKETLDLPRQETFFASVSEADLERERKAEAIVAENLDRWQDEGLAPDMAIEPGDKTDEPIRTRGWTYWHHLFNARQLLHFANLLSQIKKHAFSAELLIFFARSLDTSSRLTRWDSAPGQDRVANTFSNQALNTLMNWVGRAYWHLAPQMSYEPAKVLDAPFTGRMSVVTREASSVINPCEYWITDPPYADAINYHEITEFFIAWLRKDPPKPFD